MVLGKTLKHRIFNEHINAMCGGEGGGPDRVKEGPPPLAGLLPYRLG